MKKFVGYILIGCVFLSVAGLAFNNELSNGLYTLAGLGYFVFGTWAGVLLVK